MSEDVLQRFIQAYRDENPGQRLDSLAVRRRLLGALGRRQKRRARFFRAAVPLAATFFGTAALAASGPQLERIRDFLGANATSTSSPGGDPVAPKRPRRPAPPAQEPAPVSESVEPAPSIAVEELALEPVPRQRGNAPPARESTARGDDPLRADLALYESAHRLHFQQADSARALVGWDRYLRSYPAGTFAPEARLNRAVCLVRLGRESEARRALELIAEGRFGPYGRARAKSLIAALDSGRPE